MKNLDYLVRCGDLLHLYQRNIAEGFKRKTNKDSIRFYNMAECSLEELKYQLILARDLDYIKDNQFGKLNEQAEEASKLLNGWINSHKKSLLSV